ncbi:MAG TPA: PQQ-dependent sugar dehydrogenase [Pirellulales bacterium]|nr:PQQ-dependent sugar dehydrogenase [Pirellulales bacterium]
MGYAWRILRPSLPRVQVLALWACVLLGVLIAAARLEAAYPTGPQITDRYDPGQINVAIQDYATAPNTASSQTDRTAAQVARINFMRSDPVDPNKYVVNDLNGNLYTLDKTTRQFTTFFNFASVFPNFDNNPGLAAGLVTIQFDPNFDGNPALPGYGEFYTTHTETVGNQSSFSEGVLTEWQISNPADFGNPADVSELSHREMLRVAYSSNIHPLGDIIFDPNAKPGDADYRMMYIASGDGAAGESGNPATRAQDQMLNNYLGKVLRILPNGVADTTPYAIPSDNPFASAAFTSTGAKGEIWAYGFRNPHRLSWDPQSNQLIVDNIGLHSYEEVNFVTKGQNYGYSSLEGNQVLSSSSNQVTNAPLPATLPLTISPGVTSGSIVPTYPVVQYSHEDGDAVSSGFVYHGAGIPQLDGKYVFGDITSGRLFYVDYAAMLAQESLNAPLPTSDIHELNLLENGSPIRLFDLVHSTFDLRNDGVADGDVLPGADSSLVTAGDDPYGVAYGGGRADIRLIEGDDGEIYIISKSDGMIRELVAVPEPAAFVLLELGGSCLALAGARSARRKKNDCHDSRSNSTSSS